VESETEGMHHGLRVGWTPLISRKEYGRPYVQHWN